MLRRLLGLTCLLLLALLVQKNASAQLTASSQQNTTSSNLIDIAGTVNNLNIDEATNVAIGGANAAQLLRLETTSCTPKINISRLYNVQPSGGIAVIAQATTAACAPTITVRDSNIAAQTVCTCAVNGTTVILDNDVLTTMTSGAVNANGVAGGVTVNVHARNVNLTGGQWAATQNSATMNWWHEPGNSTAVSLGTSVPTGFVIRGLACDSQVLPTVSAGFNSGVFPVAARRGPARFLSSLVRGLIPKER